MVKGAKPTAYLNGEHVADEERHIENFSEAPDDSPFGEPRLPSLFWALVPILCMAGLMLYVFGWVADSETYDAAHLPLLCSTVVACAM